MAIETTCQGCQKLLRVGDQHAGKPARCPSCGTIYTVPGRSVTTSSLGYSPLAFSEPAPQSKPSERWLMKTAEGHAFGPVPRGELDRWLAEGRITPQSQLQQEGSFQWLPAGQVYPQLQMPAALNHPPSGGSPFSTNSSNPFADKFAPPNAYAPAAAGGAYNWPGGSARWREPHRGGAVLALALVGAFFCDLLSIAAVIMAIVDLSKMSSGQMDPSGRGLTTAGLVIAILKLVFMLGLVFTMAVNEM